MHRQTGGIAVLNLPPTARLHKRLFDRLFLRFTNPLLH